MKEEKNKWNKTLIKDKGEGGVETGYNRQFRKNLSVFSLLQIKDTIVC